jgi:hypothetical protein
VFVVRVTTHRVAPPDAKVTVPVAPPGRPLAANVELVPKDTLDGVALAANDVVACVTVSDVAAVDPASSASPEYVATIG